MAKTGGSGSGKPDLTAWAGDIKPILNAIYSLGSKSFKWLALFVVTVFATTLIIGGAIKLDVISNELWINGTTNINGSLDVRDNINATTINATMIEADYFYGDGSQLTGVVGDNATWNESYANTLYLLLTGGIMSGDLYMGYNDILNVTDINATYINSTLIQADYFYGSGAYLTGLVTENVSWNESRANDLYVSIGTKLGNTTAEIKTVVDAYPTGNTTAEIVTVINAYPTGNTTAELTTWVQINRSENIVFSKNVTAENFVLETDPIRHYIIDNATCISIFGDTSELHIC